MSSELNGSDDVEEGMFADEADDSIPVDYEIDDDGMDSLSDEEKISLSGSSDGEDNVVAPDKPSSWPDQVNMIHLRRYIDQLADQVQENNFQVQKTREELKECRAHMEELQQERDKITTQIQQAEETNNTAALFRLKANHKRLCTEVENEVELEAKIADALDKNEYILAKSQVEQGKLLLAEDNLKQQEVKLQEERVEQVAFRNKKEQSYADQALKRRRAEQRAQASAMNRQQHQCEHQVEEAIRSHEKASKYREQTITKMRQREAEEEERQKEHMEKRMTSMLKLKKDIANNRENLRALQARDNAFNKVKDAVEDKKRQAIESSGGNPSELMIKQKRIEEFEKEKELFKLKQRERQIDIADKILQEEERMKKRKHQQPYLFTEPKKEDDKIVKPHPRRKIQAVEGTDKTNNNQENYQVDYSRFEGLTGDESGDEDGSMSPLARARERTVLNMVDDQGEKPNLLVKPEFEGMWDKHKPYKVPKDQDTEIKLPNASKMEKEFEVKPDIMKKVLDKHRGGIVVKQVAGGKEFTGQPFYSKPDVIHFKDFDVGKSYKKKVILTNVSYSVNYCKLVGLTEHLKDFIDLHFDPPGQMSAGLTCELMVTFKPKLNEDLSGEVQFLAQTGPFSIPLVCTTKKCDLKVDKTLVEFGTSVIGETLKRTFTLSNNGALGTKYDLYKVTGMKLRTVTTAETSLGRLTTTDTHMNGVSPDSEKIKKVEDKTNTGKDNSTEKQDTDKAADGNQDPKEDGEMDAAGTGEGQDGGETERTNRFGFSDDSGDVLDQVDDLYSLDGMTVGAITSGTIGPFSTVKLEIVWQPTIPGKVETEFSLTFEDPESDKILIMAVANAIDVPVWVERQNIDLKICMLDRLYQDTIIVNNRATTALRLKFEVCKALKNHLELLPKTGYIQAQSQFSAQLKFLPRPSFFEEAGEYFDKETGVLEAPMIIRVADQTRPVPFTVHAVVTNSDLQFDLSDVDFGCCTIHESVTKTVKLTNHSVLPQQFGFLGIPEYMDIQPNDGFGTLLPMETVELDLIFSPSKAKEFNFELACKSLINREFKIQCKGVGVHTPLELSSQIIHFAATALDDVSTASMHVINSHTSRNEFTHPVPRIGKEDIAPVGPTSFEFVVPEGAPVSISPAVGTVEPGKKCHIHVTFSPHLDDSAIRKEAVRMVTRTMEAQAKEEYKAALEKEKEAQEQANQGKGPKKGAAPAKGKASPKGKGQIASQANVAAKGPAHIDPPKEDKFTPDSKEYIAAHTSLLRQFRGRFGTFVVPCYVASGKCGNPGELPYSVQNTLYLELHCPVVKPELVVISDNGKTTVDFGDVSIGQNVMKSVTVQNISGKTIELTSSCLHTGGPFIMVNALRMLPPEGSHTMILCFTPQKGDKFQEVLDIKCPISTLHLTLKGHGVNPVISLSVQKGVMDMGAIISGEYREETFKIMNTSKLAIQYTIKLDSVSLLRYAKSQELPHFVKPHKKQKNLVGTQNKNGRQVFDCVPIEGSIHPGDTKEIMVTFAPDQASDYYSDFCRIELFGQEEQHVFQLVGQGKSHIMYMEGGERLTPEIESLAALPLEDFEDDSKPPPIPLLVMLSSVSKDTEFATATKEIYVGCVRTMAVSQKKGGRQNGEWSFDSLQPITALGFNIEPTKGMIEAATKRPITITWTPPPGYDASQPMRTSIMCTVKGDVTEQYKILLRGIVVSE